MARKPPGRASSKQPLLKGTITGAEPSPQAEQNARDLVEALLRIQRRRKREQEEKRAHDESATNEAA